MANRRKKGKYFQQSEEAPAPLVVRVERRVGFNEVDAMRIVWFGRYPVYLEEGSAELGRRCGLSYKDFAGANLAAPIAQCHIDYHRPLALDEVFTITASLVWSEGARLNTEYSMAKEDGSIAATAYTVQMFIRGVSGEACFTSPELLEQLRTRWKAGELSWLK
jgi:acyl-CoA thioester hydrolase